MTCLKNVALMHREGDEAGELRAHRALPEDPRFAAPTLDGSQVPVAPAPGDPMPLEKSEHTFILQV